MYEDARLFCDWLETAEWMTREAQLTLLLGWGGPGGDGQIKFPIDMTVIRRLAAATEHLESGVLWQLMVMIGEDLMSFICSMREKLNFLRNMWNYGRLRVQGGGSSVFTPSKELPDDVSSGMIRYVLM